MSNHIGIVSYKQRKEKGDRSRPVDQPPRQRSGSSAVLPVSCMGVVYNDVIEMKRTKRRKGRIRHRSETARHPSETGTGHSVIGLKRPVIHLKQGSISSGAGEPPSRWPAYEHCGRADCWRWRDERGNPCRGASRDRACGRRAPTPAVSIR